MSKLNEFMKKKAQIAINGSHITDDYKTYVIKQAELLSNLGIEDEITLRKLHHISQLVPVFVRRATNIHSPKLYAKVIEYVFKNKDDIDNVDKLKGMILEALEEQNNIVKKSYPLGDQDVEPIISYDVGKWIKAKNNIDIKTRLFKNTISANMIQKEVTKGWSDMEINKFNDWVRFYEQGGHLVYKMADARALFTNNNTFPLQHVPGMNKNEFENSAVDLMHEHAEKRKQEREILQKIKGSLVSRISSAKKILASELGQTLVGNEYEKLLKTLMQVEETLLTLKTPKLMADVLARAECTLKKDGYAHAAFMFNKIAQDTSLDGGSPDGGNKDDLKKAIIETLNDSSAWDEKYKLPSNDEFKKEIEKEKSEAESDETNPINTDTPPTDLNAPPPPPPVTANYKWALYKTAELDRLENMVNIIGETIKSVKSIRKLAQQIPIGSTSNATKFFTEDSLDKAFANIKLSDVIKRMQALVRVFKNREIARQLSIIDLMLDKLGIAGLFPQLAEATKSSLESNQYSGTRVEEILSKLMSMADEGGNVNPQLGQSIKPSLIDNEMQEALQQPDIITPQKVNNQPSLNPMVSSPPQPTALPKPPLTPNAIPGLL